VLVAPELPLVLLTVVVLVPVEAVPVVVLVPVVGSLVVVPLVVLVPVVGSLVVVPLVVLVPVVGSLVVVPLVVLVPVVGSLVVVPLVVLVPLELPLLSPDVLLPLVVPHPCGLISQAVNSPLIDTSSAPADRPLSMTLKSKVSEGSHAGSKGSIKVKMDQSSTPCPVVF